MKLRKKILFVIGLSACLMIGCSDKQPATTPTPTENPTEIPTETPTATPTPTVSTTPRPTIKPTVIPTAEPLSPDGDFIRSCLTGSPIIKETAAERVVAIMYSNRKEDALQEGIVSSIIYEAPVEGDMTSLMGLCEFKGGSYKIGPVGSASAHFMDYAAGFDAVYIHNGMSDEAEPALDLSKIDNLSSVSGAGKDAFYSADDRISPYNVYTSLNLIQKGIELGKLRTNSREDYVPQYVFAAEEFTPINAEPAYRVYPGYSYNEPWFEYDVISKSYRRYQFGDKHIEKYYAGTYLDEDGVLQEDIRLTHLACKNIILEYTTCNPDEGDSGALNIDTHTKNKSKYITNGAVVDITWERDENSVVHYKDMEGNPLIMNQGATWVCIILDAEAVRIEASR